MNTSDVGCRAWNFLPLALLWSRKAGVFKRRVIVDLMKHLKSFLHNTEPGAFHYGEREFSFNDSPFINLKMNRPSLFRFKLPHIPCINPQVDSDYDFEFKYGNDDILYCSDVMRKSFLKGADHDEYECEVSQEIIPCDDEGIDRKAEEFIAKFYQQMKLQR